MKVRRLTRFLLVPSVVVLMLAVAACGGSAAPATTPAAKATTAPAGSPAAKTTPGAGGATTGDAAKGKTLFAQNCSSCHGPDAKGLPGLGKDLVTSTFAKGLTDQQLIDFIIKGRPASDPANTTHVDMPPKGGNPALTTAQIADIVAYLRTLEK